MKPGDVIVNLLFKHIEIMGLQSRVLWKLVFALGDAHLIDVDDRLSLKKLLKELDKQRMNYGLMVNDGLRSGGELDAE